MKVLAPVTRTVAWPCRAYLYLKQQDEEAINATTQAEEATREEGVPLQWTIATEISNATTFMVSLATVFATSNSRFYGEEGVPLQWTIRDPTPPPSWCSPVLFMLDIYHPSVTVSERAPKGTRYCRGASRQGRPKSTTIVGTFMVSRLRRC